MPQATVVGRKHPRPGKAGLEGETSPLPKGEHPSLGLWEGTPTVVGVLRAHQ